MQYTILLAMSSLYTILFVNALSLSYEIMRHCWYENSQDRPSFSQLQKHIEEFLISYVQDNYPYIEIPVSYSTFNTFNVFLGEPYSVPQQIRS